MCRACARVCVRECLPIPASIVVIVVGGGGLKITQAGQGLGANFDEPRRCSRD